MLIESILYSAVCMYISSKNAVHGLMPEQKTFRDWTEAMLFWPGTVPVPAPVLSLAKTFLL